MGPNSKRSPVGWRRKAICDTHFGCICTGSGRCSTDVTDFNPEGCSRKRISGKRSLFPVRVPTSISAPAASSPASWPLQDAWFRVERTDALSLLRCRYHHFLAEVRGLSQQSLKQHGTTVADFLSRGLSPDRGLSGLTAADVEAFVQTKSQENNRQSLQHIVAQLRAFLRYCGDHGEAPGGLDVIDTPRVYRGELPPRALDWTTVRRLLASIWRRSPRDWRDYTVLHLMAYYGLRPSEVAALRLDAVDWEAGTLRVDQRKTRSILILPLAARTLCLLRRYLQVGRADSDLPQLFLRIRSPIRAINHYGIIDIFNYRAARSGLPLDSASSYSLRHAFAMRLLRRGVGIKVIGDLLGHRSLEATCVYLRVDIDMLRTVGLPVPGIASVAGGDHA